MKNLFTVNFAEMSIVATKITLKKASVPNSPEYKALMELMKQNPTFAIAEKKIKDWQTAGNRGGHSRRVSQALPGVSEEAVECVGTGKSVRFE